MISAKCFLADANKFATRKKLFADRLAICKGFFASYIQVHL